MVQSFNRIDDPLVDQSGAKLLGAAAGGYAGWKHHSNIAQNRGLLSKLTLGLGTGPFMRPLRTLGGMGIGALAAGVLARMINKRHKDQQAANKTKTQKQKQITQGTLPRRSYGFGGGGMAGALELGQHDYEKYAALQLPNQNQNQNPYESDVLTRGVRGGLLGLLGGALTGIAPGKMAAIGAALNVGHDLYKKKQNRDLMRAIVKKQYGIQEEPQQPDFAGGYYPKYASDITSVANKIKQSLCR